MVRIRVSISVQGAHQPGRAFCGDLPLCHHLEDLLALLRGHYLPPSKAFRSSSACWAVIFFSASIFRMVIRSSSTTGSEGGSGGFGGLGMPFPNSQFQRPISSPPLSLIHISEPTRLLSISYAVFC